MAHIEQRSTFTIIRCRNKNDRFNGSNLAEKMKASTPSRAYRAFGTLLMARGGGVLLWDGTDGGSAPAGCRGASGSTGRGVAKVGKQLVHRDDAQGNRRHQFGQPGQTLLRHRVSGARHGGLALFCVGLGQHGICNPGGEGRGKTRSTHVPYLRLARSLTAVPNPVAQVVRSDPRKHRWQCEGGRSHCSRPTRRAASKKLQFVALLYIYIYIYAFY